jgi:hypothetical protein
MSINTYNHNKMNRGPAQPVLGTISHPIPTICNYCNKEFPSKKACERHDNCCQDKLLKNTEAQKKREREIEIEREIERENPTGSFCEICQCNINKYNSLSVHNQVNHREDLEDFLNRILPDDFKSSKRDHTTKKIIELYTHLTILAIRKYTLPPSLTEDCNCVNMPSEVLDADEFSNIMHQIEIFVHRFSAPLPTSIEEVGEEGVDVSSSSKSCESFSTPQVVVL